MNKKQYDKLEYLATRFGDGVRRDYLSRALEMDEDGTLTLYPDYPGLRVKIVYEVRDGRAALAPIGIVGSTLAQISRTVAECKRRVSRMPKEVQVSLYSWGEFGEVIEE